MGEFIRKHTWLRAAIVIGLVVASLYAIDWGFRARRMVFDSTIAFHFQRDIENAYAWGRNTKKVGLFNIYDMVEQGTKFGYIYPLDYSPLRLTLATNWYAWTVRNNPGEKQFQMTYDSLMPMLICNTIAALLAAVFAFLLVRMWIIRTDDARRPLDRPPRPFRGVFMGLLAAMLLWFNPGALWDGYAWLQWEIWPIPFYLAAVYLACRDRWFAAGMCLAVGALLKAQLLIASPVLFLWPIVQLRFGAVLRLLSGMALTWMLILFPWLRPTPPAYLWYVLMLVGLTLLTPFVLRWKLDRRWLITLATVALIIAWPWGSSASIRLRFAPPAIIGLVLVLTRILSPRLLPHLYALTIASTIALMIPLFGASTAWYNRSLEHGTERTIVRYRPTYNVPAMGISYLNWPDNNAYHVTIPLLGRITVWTWMLVLHGLCLLLCGFGAAIHFRRNDSRFLLAIFLPWFTLYMLLTQLQARYLVWAAVASSVLAAVGWGWLLMGMVITYFSYISIDQNLHGSAGLLNMRPPFYPPEPHIGLMLLLMAAIMLYGAIMPRRNRSFMPARIP